MGSQDGDTDAVKSAISQRAFLEARRPFVVTPETSAGGVSKADINARGTGLTPLMYASKGAYLSAMELLVSAKANLEAQDEDGIRSLHLAAMSGELDAVSLLLKAGAEAYAEDDEGRTAMEHVPIALVRTAKERQVWESLFKQGGGGLCGMTKVTSAV